MAPTEASDPKAGKADLPGGLELGRFRASMELTSAQRLAVLQLPKVVPARRIRDGWLDPRFSTEPHLSEMYSR